MEALGREKRLLISAVTIAESLIVAERKGAIEQVTKLIDGLAFDLVTVTHASARRAAAYGRWGARLSRRVRAKTVGDAPW